MKLFYVGKDGGPESNVSGFWLCEIKSLFSVALLRFDHGSRNEFHSHAFHCVSWLLKGRLIEQELNELGRPQKNHTPSLLPIFTWRDTFHRVTSLGTSWVLTFRGPWSKTWREFDPKTGEFTTLTNGRKLIQ